MIECIFTLDYEIYGNGAGSLKDLVYEPGEKLREIFLKRGARFVNFVEVAELQQIEKAGTDPGIELVKRQIANYYREGFEIALHLHPQWCNARYDGSCWLLDYSEYNLCELPRKRISEIVENSLEYLRHLVSDSQFSPLSFRAGNWLFQPTHHAASVLAENGIRIDSSVFKGGLQHNHNLDYRPAMKNGYYWPFSNDVNKPDATGPWIEVPIYAEMVSSWKMIQPKRVGMGAGFGGSTRNLAHKINRLRDFLRFRYPLKLDFCRMTLDELTSMMEKLIAKDQKNPASYKPIVAIGHTKDLKDPKTVDAFLSFLHAKGIPTCTFSGIYSKLSGTNFPAVPYRSLAQSIH